RTLDRDLWKEILNALDSLFFIEENSFDVMSGPLEDEEAVIVVAGEFDVGFEASVEMVNRTRTSGPPTRAEFGKGGFIAVRIVDEGRLGRGKVDCSCVVGRVIYGFLSIV